MVTDTDRSDTRGRVENAGGTAAIDSSGDAMVECYRRLRGTFLKSVVAGVSQADQLFALRVLMELERSAPSSWASLRFLCRVLNQVDDWEVARLRAICDGLVSRGRLMRKMNGVVPCYGLPSLFGFPVSGCVVS